MPNALITGSSGQDGAYLARLLLDCGYKVHGTTRQTISIPAQDPLTALNARSNVHLHCVDLNDFDALQHLIEATQPDEIYHLAAQTSVAASFQEPLETGATTGLAAVRLMEATRQTRPQARFFQASSSEIFGESNDELLDENTPLRPRNPYGAAKAFAHQMAQTYRESYGLGISCGILFNHESPLRSERFVTRKITLGVARIKLGLQDSLPLGNLEVRRDWGFAGDYARAMHLMLQAEPDDYVLATGKLHSLRDFVSLAFECVGLKPEPYVYSDPALVRPSDALAPRAKISKARTKLNWTPRVSFETLIALMVEADLKRLRGETDIRYFPEAT